ncbi:MAG: GtrA family protein [Bacteroidota bacterium]
MKERLEKLQKLFMLKAKFALSSLVATSVNIGLYMLLVNKVFAPVPSEIIAYSVAVVINYILQRKFVFSLKRKEWQAFTGAMLVSLGGLILSTLIIYLLNLVPFFQENQLITKLCAVGIVFFYNFYFKRFAFERRFFGVD